MKQLNAFPLLLLIVNMFGVFRLGFGQSLFQTVRPDVLVLVKKHPSGADIVEISVTKASFPPELLRDRLTALCTDLGYGPHGLQVFQSQINGSGDEMRFLKARFGTNGLIDSLTGRLRIQAIVRAFAGIPAPDTVTGLSVVFDAFKPSKETLQKYKSATVNLEAQFNPPPASGLEYRVLLASQDPRKIEIPDHAEPIAAQKPSEGKTGASSTPSWITWVLIGVPATSFGALVYFGFLRFSAKRR